MGFATINAIANAIRQEEERHKKKIEELKRKKEKAKKGIKW